MKPVWKIVGILAGCFVVVLIAVAVAVWLSWRHFAPIALEAGKSAMERGKTEGTASTENDCLRASIERHRMPKNLGFGAAISENLRLTGCLEASAPSAEFCEGVPSDVHPVELGLWAGQRCNALDFHDPYCTQIFQTVAKYCASPARQNKTPSH